MLPFDRLEKSNTKENLWLYILLILRKGPFHAWDLWSKVEKEFGFRPGQITPYRVLYRLESDGFVKSELKEPRRIYHITAKGEKELKKAKLFFKSMAEYF